MVYLAKKNLVAQVLYTTYMYEIFMTETPGKNGLRDRLLLPALLLSMFLTFTVMVFFSTLLVDIADTFNVSIGTASQIQIIISVVGVIVSLATGILAIRFKQKTLLLTGIATFTIGVLGFFLAQNFQTLLLFQLFLGVGTALIGIMIYPIIGDHIPLHKRGWAIGLTIAGGDAAFIIVGPLSGIISTIAGWRSVLLWFILPLSITCLILSQLIIPTKPNPLYTPPKQPKQDPTKTPYLKAFKQIFHSKSATACIVGTALFTSIGVVPIYAVSFYRVAFSVSPTMGGALSSIAALGAITGSISGGKLINKCGRKPLTIASATISGATAIAFSYIPNMPISVALWLIAAFTASTTIVALFNLILEQIPQFKASMMSANSAFRNIGLIAGITAGGLILNIYQNNFQLLMTVLGVLGIATAPIILVFAKDPCKTTNK